MEIKARSDIQAHADAFFFSDDIERHPGEIIPDLLQQYSRLWWSCDRSFPDFVQVYTPGEQQKNEKKLEGIVNQMAKKLKNSDQKFFDGKLWVKESRPDLIDFGRQILRLDQVYFDLIESSGMAETLGEFFRMARQFDAKITAEDIYQAGRNVMTANFIQMLLGIPVRVTPSIFAYSMLYPYTDNYLDDPGIPYSTKVAFNQRFRDRLLGKAVEPANPYEVTITRLIEMIESEWEPDAYPQVYESLLAIHTAQTRSLILAGDEPSPFELDVLGISLEKGGTSVLADGYLAAGVLTRKQASLLFGFGSFTQLMDDLEDIQQDLRENRASLFSLTAGKWPLERLTNQFIHYGKVVTADLSAFPSPSVSLLHEISARCLDLILINTAANAGGYYSREYLGRMEAYMPFRFGMLQKQRQKLQREKINFEQVMQWML
jgi:hypothetical protein